MESTLMCLPPDVNYWGYIGWSVLALMIAGVVFLIIDHIAQTGVNEDGKYFTALRIVQLPDTHYKVQYKVFGIWWTKNETYWSEKSAKEFVDELVKKQERWIKKQHWEAEIKRNKKKVVREWKTGELYSEEIKKAIFNEALEKELNK